MRIKLILVLGSVILLSVSCVSVGKIARHDFDSGFYKLKTPGASPSRVYTNVIEDSIVVYPVIVDGKKEFPNASSGMGTRISRIKTDNYFYKSCFINNSVDVDLTSILFKYRHPRDDVPGQFSADLNFAIYMGFRKDFYKVASSVHPLLIQQSPII